MVKLIIQRKKRNTMKNTRFRSHKKFSSLVKVLELFLRCQSWYWHISGSTDVVSPSDWLESSIWSFCPQDYLESWGEIRLPTRARVVRVVFTRQQLHCPSAVGLFGQLLPQQCGTIPFWVLPSVPEISSGIHHLPSFGRLACHLTLVLRLYASPNPCWVLVASLGGWLVAPPHCSQPL
jgi:hypothetical protein